MNRYQKEKSREIRDIMRSDKWGRMTYKEARRKWRSGIRAFLVDSRMNAWVVTKLGHLGMSRSRLRELGQAYRKIIMYCAERNLGVNFYHEPRFDDIVLRFYGWSLTGQKYSVAHTIRVDQIRQYAGALDSMVDYILGQVNKELQEVCFPSPVQPDIFKLSYNTFNPYYGEKFLLNAPVGVVTVKGE